MRGTPSERFWAKVSVGEPDECWLWQGAKLIQGYGNFGLEVWPGGKFMRMIGAHRFAYIDSGGEIPEGLAIDHLCGTKLCCNPRHLEPVTLGENTRRWLATRPARTHCDRGHEVTPENIRPSHGGCKECHRVVKRAWKAKQRNADRLS